MIIAGAPGLVGTDAPDLSALPWIADMSTGGTVTDNMVRAAGCDPEDITWIDPGDARHEIEMGVMGYGLLSGPEIIMRPQLESGALVRLLTVSEMSGVYYAITGRGPLGCATRNFLDWLVEHCRKLQTAP